MIDCHLHLQDQSFSGNLDEIMSVSRKAGISTQVVNGTCPEDWNAVANLAGKFQEVEPSFGLHPWKINQAGKGWLETLEDWLLKFPNAGVGEIGLDRWIKGHDLAAQSRAFVAQLELAGRHDRPVSVHCLKAWGSMSNSIDRVGTPLRILFHSFTGPVEMVDALVARG